MVRVFLPLLCVALTANAFFLDDRSFPFGHQFWRNFENGMKKLEDSLKDMDRSPNTDKDDTALASSEDSEVFTHGDDSFGFFPGIFSFGVGNQWWMGKNVCVTKEEVDLSENDGGSNETIPSSFFDAMMTRSETCSSSNGRYTCVNTVRGRGKHVKTTVTYECCHGRRLRGNRCVEVQLRNLTQIANESAPEFTRMMDTAGVLDPIENGNENVTMFVTADDFLDDVRDTFQEMNQLNEAITRRKRAELGNNVSHVLNEIFMNHIVKGVHHTYEFSNNEMLTTLGGKKLRVNVYREMMSPVYTVNCARVTSGNKMADKGVVHVVEGVLRPVVRTVADVLEGDERFTIFRSMVEKSGLMEQLRKDDVTIFVPTDDAIRNNLSTSAYRMYIDEGRCMDEVVNHHVTPHVLCLSGLSTNWNVGSLIGERLHLVKSDADQFTVNDIDVVSKDLVATNGIVHVIDGLLLPDAAKTLQSMLSQRNLHTFANLLEEAGSDFKPDGNVSFFVPREEAFTTSEAKSYLEEIHGDKAKLLQLLKYHSSQPMIRINDLENEKMLPTMADDLSLRYNFYLTGPGFSFAKPRATVQCARVRIAETKACGAAIHEVDRLLIPPKGDVVEILSDRPEFSILRKVIEKAEMEQNMKDTDAITLLAPTDDAFNDLTARDLNSILNDKEKARKVLERHIVVGTVCCHGVQDHQFLFPHLVSTQDGARIDVRRDYRGQIHFQKSRVTKCDQMGTNGIIHTVNRVMIPFEEKSNDNPFNFMGGNPFKMTGKNPNVDVLLFGI